MMGAMTDVRVPDTMLAAVLIGNGGPEMLEVRSDVPLPAVGLNDALIRVAACGVNNTDINTRVGWYSRSVTTATAGEGFDGASLDDSTWGRDGLRFPRIQGADICGEVVSVGASADSGLIGCRVLVDPWIRDQADPSNRELAGYLGSESDGGFAEYCSVPAANVHPIDSALSDVELATFACSSSTAEHMLQRVGLRAGQSIAVPGASGGVGSALIQLAKHRGARVVAICGASKIDQVRELGADAVIERGADAPERAREANESDFDVVADVVGGLDFVGWLDALRRGGRYVTSGAIAGPIVELDLRTLYLNDLELFGATVFEPTVFSNLVGHIEQGAVRPVLSGTYPLERIHEAQVAFERKDHVGSLVITLKQS
jgi:NADPH:quinone reductase-like Zn-dependent oxidoreductase